MNEEKEPINNTTEDSKGPRMSPEDLELLIKQNEMIKLSLLVMNDINLNREDDDDINYEELWNKVSLQKKVDAGPVTDEAKAMYYDLFSTGYENFGSMFFYHLAKEENAPYLYHGIKSLLQALADYSDMIENLVYVNTDLTNQLENKNK